VTQIRRQKVWKVNLFHVGNKRHYDALISFDDLKEYYESQIFEFYEQNRNIVRPNLVQLLQDYIRNLHIWRSVVGYSLFWRLPQFKRPISIAGQVHTVQHANDLEMLSVYMRLQRKIDEFNKEEDSNALPFSLD